MLKLSIRSIQTKIVLPFTLLFALVIAVSTSIAITLVYKQVDARIEEEMSRLAKALSITGSALNSDFLENVKRAVGIEIVVYDKEFKTIASTISDYKSLESQIRLRFSDKIDQIDQIDLKTSKIRYQNKPYQARFKRFRINEPDSNRLLVLMMPTSDISATKKRVTLSVFIVAFLAILLLAATGHLIAKNITAPIEELLSLTKRVASGDLEHESYESQVKSPDEIGELTVAFNQMTKQLKLFQNQLIESERLAMAGQMAAAFAHDIRNPLSSIKMIAQLLKKRLPTNDENEKYIQSIIDEINRLDATIKSRLAIIRPIRPISSTNINPTELKLQKANLNDILLELLNFMEANMTHHHIKLERSFNPSIPEMEFDLDMLKQAFMNAILNSIQAMPNGGKFAISSDIEFGVDGASSVSVEINDTGIGMSKETLSRLFTPFYTTKEGGTGLGLLNAKSAIEQHGGTLEVSSQLGVGTEVRIRLPIKE